MRFEADTHSHTLAKRTCIQHDKKKMAAAAEAKRLKKRLRLRNMLRKMPGTCGCFIFKNLDVVPRNAEEFAS